MMRRIIPIFLITLAFFVFGTGRVSASISGQTDQSYVSISYSPPSGVRGSDYTLKVSSANINPNSLSVNCRDRYTDKPDVTNTYSSDPSSIYYAAFLLANTDLNFFGTVPIDLTSMTCTASGVKTGQSFSNTATFTVTPPSCTASVEWDTQSPITAGQNATEKWNISFFNLGNVLARAGTQINSQSEQFRNMNGATSWSGTYVFGSNNDALQQDTAITLKGYVSTDNGQTYTQTCSYTSAVMQVNPAPASATGGKISVSVSSYGGFSWKLQNGSGWSQTGAGPTRTAISAPFGQYELNVVGGWNSNVVTSVTANPSNTLTAPAGTSPGTSPSPGGVTPTCPNGGTYNSNTQTCVYPAPTPPSPPNLTPVDPSHRIILKLDPLEFISGLVQKVLAQTIPSITFTVNSRPVKVVGTLSITPSNSTVFPASAEVTGSANDPADGYKTLDLNKTFTRISDNSKSGPHVTDAWNGIVTDGNGGWSTASGFYCDGRDGSPFADGDYEDASHVLYDQGDHTGDTSPPIYIIKGCGGDFELQSVDSQNHPVDIDWTLTGPHSTWTNNDSRVYKGGTLNLRGYYAMRLDQGLQALSITPPVGYSLQSSSFYNPTVSIPKPVISVVSAQTTGGPCSGTGQCPFSMSQPGARVGIKVVWASGGVTTGIPVVCSQTTPNPITVGQPVSFQASYGTGFSSSYVWSAPEGTQTSGTGLNFNTSFNSAGTKDVTVINNNISSTCTVNVTSPPQLSPTLVITPTNNTATVCSGNPVANASYAALYDPDGPSGPQPEQNVSASASTIWTANAPSIAQSLGGGVFEGKAVGTSGITATYAGLTATAVLNVETDPSCPDQPPGFSCNLSPSSISVAQGASAQGTVSFSPTGGFAGFVSLSSQNVPSGSAQSYSPNPAPASAGSTYTFSAGQSTAPGAYTVTVSASSGGVTHACPLYVAITGSPPPTCIGAIPANNSACPGTGTNLTQNTAYTAVGSAASCSPSGTLNKCEYYPTGCTGPSCTGGGFSCQNLPSGYAPCSPTGVSLTQDRNYQTLSSASQCGATGVDVCQAYPTGVNQHLGCIAGASGDFCGWIDGAGPNTDGCSSWAQSCTPVNGACTLTPTPPTINPGGSSVLSWPVSCGTNCAINGAPVSGNSLRVSPAQTTTYNLVCSLGSASAKVSVYSLQEINPGQ